MDYKFWDHTTEFRVTKKAVIDIGRQCNVKCLQCYHKNAKDNFTKSLEKIKKEITEAKNRGCNSLDFTGGEPTISPYIIDAIKFCIEKKINPRIITNCQLPNKISELIQNGCRDFLLSIHGTEGTLDNIMQAKNTWRNIIKTTEIVKENKCSFSVNTVIIKQNFKDLLKIVSEISKYDPYLYNFIFCNSQYNDSIEEKIELLPILTEVSPYIAIAIDHLENKNIATNLRYFPMCMIQEQYRKYIVNHPQVMFDWKNEWDYEVELKTVENYLSYAKEKFQIPCNSQTGKCGECNKLNICGGLKLGYKDVYGDNEVAPLSGISNNPFYYRTEIESVDIIIPTNKINNNLGLLLQEITQKTAPPYNLIIIQQEKSAARNRNEGLKRSKSKFIIMLDDDIMNLPYLWNKKLIDRLLYNPEIMAISARLLNKDGSVGKNSANNYNISSEFEEVNMIPTACCIFRKKDTEKSGINFNEKFLGSGFEDTLFFHQLKQTCDKNNLGIKMIIDNTIPVTHLNNESEAPKWFQYNKQIYKGILEND